MESNPVSNHTSGLLHGRPDLLMMSVVTDNWTTRFTVIITK